MPDVWGDPLLQVSALPLTEEEKARIERLLTPVLLRHVLESAREIEAERLTTSMDLRLHWNDGKASLGVWSAVHATKFVLR